jgi:hypothetical protein
VTGTQSTFETIPLGHPAASGPAVSIVDDNRDFLGCFFWN